MLSHAQKKKIKNGKSIPIGIRVHPKQYELLERLCEEGHAKTPSQYVNNLLSNHLRPFLKSAEEIKEES